MNSSTAAYVIHKFISKLYNATNFIQKLALAYHSLLNQN